MCKYKSRRKSLFLFLFNLLFCINLPAQSPEDKGYLYLSPVPSAPYVSHQTRFILVRFKEITPDRLTNLDSFINVTAESTGPHPGSTKIAGDNRTVIYEMTDDFAFNELVTVNLNPETEPGSPLADSYSYQFAITTLMDGSTASDPLKDADNTYIGPPAQDPQASPGRAGIMANGVSVPSSFPHIEITVNDNPDPSYIFLDNRETGKDSYSVIFDNTGSPIWYWNTDDQHADTKVQHNGMLTLLLRIQKNLKLFKFVGIDTNYTHTATYQAVNGYYTDIHELQVLENGHYLLFGFRFHKIDLSEYISGGDPSTNVGESVIQEFTAQGELIFQWRPWGNYDITDVHFDNINDGEVRFPHMNALDIDTDGHILVSCRHISEITKINRDSGKIIWRLSGIPKNNDFTYTNDPLVGFRNQHAIRTTGPNRYLLFDNGNLHEPPVSRAVEYELDLDNMTATIIWQYPENPVTSLYSSSMANTQRLDNGNTLINWSKGNLPKLTEVRPDGTKAFEMNWVDQYSTYRVWRCQWNGIALKPNLIIEPCPDNVTLLFNKFGDPDVDHYNIYGGTSPNPTSILGTSKTTLKQLTNLQNGTRYYFQVTAVDSLGNESPRSEQKDIVVNITAPGQNMVINGNFSSQQTGWTFTESNGADSQWTIQDGVSVFDITDPGSSTSDIRLYQRGMKLTQGLKYLLQFDAKTAIPQARYIEVQIGPELITPYIIPVEKHFSHVFTMNSQSDYDAILAFNLGAFHQDIQLDNVSLISVAPGDFDCNGCVEYDDLAAMLNQWLKQGKGLEADLDGNNIVQLADFTILAQSWLKFCLPN